MTDDLLTQFRSDIPLPDEATARRTYARATTAPRRPARRRVALAVAVAAFVLIPTGIALGGRLADLFEGSPPPPQVSTNFTTFNRMADQAVQQGFASKFPHVDVSRVHGVIEVQTPDGPEDMWAAPNDLGGQSFFIDFANDPAGNGGVEGIGGTADPGQQPDEKIQFGGPFWTASHPTLATIYGSVSVDAATVRVAFDDGSTVILPVVEHLFLGSVAKGATPDSVTAFDGAGNELATRMLRPSGR